MTVCTCTFPGHELVSCVCRIALKRWCQLVQLCLDRPRGQGDTDDDAKVLATLSGHDLVPATFHPLFRSAVSAGTAHLSSLLLLLLPHRPKQLTANVRQCSVKASDTEPLVTTFLPRRYWSIGPEGLCCLLLFPWLRAQSDWAEDRGPSWRPMLLTVDLLSQLTIQFRILLLFSRSPCPLSPALCTICYY